MVALTRLNVTFTRVLPVLFHCFYALFFYVLGQTTASKLSYFFNVCHQHIFRHRLIKFLLLSLQNFDGCVEVPAVDTMSKDDKAASSIAMCNLLIIPEDIEHNGITVRQAQCCLSYFCIRLRNYTNALN
jgi:hypothetical protein